MKKQTFRLERFIIEIIPMCISILRIDFIEETSWIVGKSECGAAECNYGRGRIGRATFEIINHELHSCPSSFTLHIELSVFISNGLSSRRNYARFRVALWTIPRISLQNPVEFYLDSHSIRMHYRLTPNLLNLTRARPSINN